MLNARIGTAPVNWNNEDVPDYRAWTPYEEMLDQMVEAGYDGTEFSSIFPDNPAQAKRDLAARGLTPASTFVAVNLRDAHVWEADVARVARRAEYVRALGSDVVILADSGDDRRRAIAGRVTEADGLDKGTWERVARGLEAVADACAQRDVGVVFHNHVGTFVETEGELARLLEKTEAGRIGLCLDVGHLMYGGGDVMRVMHRYGDRVRYVHLKDVDAAVLQRSRDEGLSWHDALRLGIFTEFGAGAVDFPAFFDALTARDYSGWIIVEQDTTRKTPLESARINRRYLQDRIGL